MSTPIDGQETQRTLTTPDTAAMKRRTFVVGAGTAAAGATLGVGTAGSRESSEQATRDGSDSSPAIIAHRGYAGLYPENTVGAVEAASRGGQDDAAATRGADMIEIDVMPTGDGDVVVFHDSRLAERDGGERGLTDANGVVWETATDVVTGAEVLESGETVPLLTEVLDAIPVSVGVNVEFKNPGSFDEAAAKTNPPADVDLEIEWMGLGHATNREVEEWIGEYDDVTQEDYLETHADTDWQEDLPAALEEADRAVVENGNRDYVTDQEILAWAEQYEDEGPDGVDEDLRKVPFLKTRAAAKEVGATIEFNKAEGVDSIEGADPGDYVYFAISELNDDTSNDVGDIQLERVDGGVVYRAELEEDCNVSTLEPVIVGPDGSDPAAIADDALINIDNVYVMDDGRVLCCEDADQFGRSYSNDCLYVYRPDEDTDQGQGTDADGPDEDHRGRDDA